MKILRKETDKINTKPDNWDDILCKELIDLSYAINALPGIEISYSPYLSTNKIIIYFKVYKNEDQGLFFLTRCTDFRYWKWGHSWKIELQVGDKLGKNGELPITYMLWTEYEENFDEYTSESNEKQMKVEMNSLFENMNNQIRYDLFLNIYNIDLNKFEIVDTVSLERNDKLEKLGIDDKEIL